MGLHKRDQLNWVTKRDQLNGLKKGPIEWGDEKGDQLN